MGFDFFNKIFGIGKSHKEESSQKDPVKVPESVLDRFLIHSKEIYYIDSETESLVFAFKDGKMSINDKYIDKASPAMVLLLWLQDVARDNHQLYLSIISRFEKMIGNLSEDEMRNFLWMRFRTGNTTPLPQLRIFYHRGRAIVNFLDHISSANKFFLLNDLTEEESNLITRKYGETNKIFSLNGISNDELVKIIARDLKAGKLNTRSSKQTDKQATTQTRGNHTDNTIGNDAYLLLFSAEWCGPSRRFKQEIINGGITNFSYIDVDQDSDLAEKYKIMSIPTTVLVKTNGEVIKRWNGYDDEDPGQSKFIAEIENCGYNILLYPGVKPCAATKPTTTIKTNTTPKEEPVSLPSKSPIQRDVDLAISAFESGNIQALQNCLFQLVSKLNKPRSGRLITQYPQKDRLCECFSLCLRYDWMNDSDIREVWAENGLYCIISYLVKDAKSPQDRIAGGLDLFLHVLYGYNDLKPKLQDILLKAQSIGEPIFSQTDYVKGCNYLLNQFLFMGATLVKPFASQALNGDNYRRYEEIIKNPSLNSIEIRSIFLKAQFVSRIIESILNDM